MPIYEAAKRYKERKGSSDYILLEKEYGTGSSRDWAAKGTKLAEVKAVIVESFERIHKSQLNRNGSYANSIKIGIKYKRLKFKGK